jgi:hypothetical protein
LNGGDPGWAIEARGTAGLVGERRRRTIVGDLLVGWRLASMGARGAALASGSSSKVALLEGEVELVLLPAFDGDVVGGSDQRW